MMIDELKQQEKEIQEKIRAVAKYESSNKKYYNIPIPCLLEYSVYNETKVNKDNIKECKGKLNYLRIVSEHYDNNDFIEDIESFIGGLTYDYINTIQITPEARAKLHNIIDNLEKEIMETEKAMKNE